MPSAQLIKASIGSESWGDKVKKKKKIIIRLMNLYCLFDAKADESVDDIISPCPDSAPRTIKASSVGLMR